MSENSRNLFLEVDQLLRKRSLTSQLGNLNRWQCGHVKSCLETLSCSRSELEPIPERICEELSRIVQHAKCLLRDCSNEEERLNAVISLADPRETFVKIISELQWCMELMRTSVRLNERRHSGDGQLEILQEFVSTDWISMVELVRCSIEEAWAKDREELKHKLEKLQRHPQRRGSNPEQKVRVLQKLLQRLSTDADDFLCEIQPTELTDGSSLGSGSDGFVCHSIWLGEHCASKKFKESNNKSFQREAAVLAGLCHPNVVQLLGRSVQGTRCCLVMELMLKDLDCLINTRQHIDCSGVTFPLPVALDILLQIAEGMQYLHAKHIAHRDIKPKNLLVNPVGTHELDARGYVNVKIADFGIAKTMEHSSTAGGINIGTTRYMAPEVMGKPANYYSEDGLGPERRYPRKADVYSYGVTAFYILTGVEAYSGVSGNELKQRVKCDGLRPELPAGKFPQLLVSLITRCWNQAHERPTFAQICLELRHLKALDMLCAGHPRLEALMSSIHPNEEEPERASMYQAYLKAVSSPRAEVTTSVTNVLVVGDKGAGKAHFIKKLCGQDIADDNKSNLKGSAIPDINQEWRHPSLPFVLQDSKDLGHNAADIDRITQILKHRNKDCNYHAQQAIAFKVLRRGLSEEHGQDLKNLNSDRIHLVFVLSALESPQTQWKPLMDLIKRFEVPVQLLTMNTEQDPSGEKLKDDLDKYWYLFPPSTLHQQTRCLENVNAEQLWATSQEVIMKHQIQKTAKIISRLAFRLGKNGITIASAPFIILNGDYSLSQTGIFIFKDLCKLWEVPRNIERVLFDRLVSLERDESLSRTSSRRNLESRIPSSNLDSVRPSPADGSPQLKLEPGRFLGFAIMVAKLILFCRARHPMGWLRERPVQDRRYALELVNSYDRAHGANLEFNMSPYHFGVFSKITNMFVDVSGKQTLEENLRVFLEVFFEDMLNCLPKPCPVVVAVEEVPGNKRGCKSWI